MSSKRFLTAAMALLLASGAAMGAEDEATEKRPARPRLAGPREERRPDEAAGPASRRESRALRITETQEAELLEAIKKNYPARYERMLRLRHEAPRIYRVTLPRLWRWYQGWRNMSEEGREAALQLEQSRLRMFQLMRQIRMAPPGEPRRRAIESLREALREQFEAEQLIREKRLAQLEEELKRIRAEMKERSERQREIIDERLERLMESPPRLAGPQETVGAPPEIPAPRLRRSRD
jgi:hypothetical protein